MIIIYIIVKSFLYINHDLSIYHQREQISHNTIIYCFSGEENVRLMLFFCRETHSSIDS